MRLLILRLPALLLAAGLVVLAVFNTTPVRIHLPGISQVIESPLYLVFLAGLVLGVLLAALVSLPRRWRSWRRARRAERRMTHLLRQGPGGADSQANETPERSLVAIDRAQGRSASAPPARR